MISWTADYFGVKYDTDSGHLNMYSFLPAIVSLLFLGYGFYAVASWGINRITASFFLVCLTTFFWQGTWAVLFQVESINTAILLAKFGYFFILFLPSAMYHFLTEITGLEQERKFVYLSYGLAATLAIFLIGSNLFVSGVYVYHWGYYPKAGFLHPFHVFQTSAIVLRSIQITYRAQQFSSVSRRIQLHLCLATLIFFAVSGIDYLCNYGFDFYPPGVIFLATSLIIFSIAIVNFDLFNPMALAGTIAHEIRTPLATIHNQASGISRHLPDLVQGYRLAVDHGLMQPSMGAKELNYLSDMSGRISEEVRKSNVMIDMILASGAMEQPEALSFERHFIGACIDEALESYPFEVGEKDRIKVEVAENFEFIGSNTLMVFVLFNLLKNAMHALKTSRVGCVRILAQQSDGHNLLLITDTGSGIPGHVLPRIFDPFFSTKSQSGGIGLGLHFCKKVMTAFKGSIECKSVEGAYTTFVLEFPAA